MKKESYRAIGVMAGSSMDGLDIAEVLFKKEEKHYTFELLRGETVPYEKELFDRLSSSAVSNTAAKKKLDIDFGTWIGETIGISSINGVDIDFIAVHGHTIEHNPAQGVSWQLGNGNVIAEKVGCPVVTDFRSQDIKLGGQGAPLVPFADFMLFKEFDACLNLGGICNISIREKKKAWDISPCNQVLNFFANKLGKPFDQNGDLARKGSFDTKFYDQVVTIPYFKKQPPKSLPNNYIKRAILESVDPKDGLHTYNHFLAGHISQVLTKYAIVNLLTSGGGAYNSFLLDLLRSKSKSEITIPQPEIIDFKEAIVFAFLGMMRMKNEVNVLASVTGASKDSSSGVIHIPE